MVEHAEDLHKTVMGVDGVPGYGRELGRVTGLDEDAPVPPAGDLSSGLSAVGAATIFAQTGDLRRFTTARAVAKHAGLAPRQRASGAFTGRTTITGQGRPSWPPGVASWRYAATMPTPPATTS
jgi:hypothetical protein